MEKINYNCEKRTTYNQRLKTQFNENSMIYKFYLWLSKKNKGEIEE